MLSNVKRRWHNFGSKNSLHRGDPLFAFTGLHSYSGLLVARISYLFDEPAEYSELRIFKMKLRWLEQQKRGILSAATGYLSHVNSWYCDYSNQTVKENREFSKVHLLDISSVSPKFV